ncbi:G3E family GTPase [Bacillus mesophilus]|uniref:GTP-binding protein n=1 Tax=Bacillus mesophilus TaxID=1808955 RepID=A0A6M0QA42_9BACI|nr:GTP-binding protein [Bacillus mesophilus]MBM7662046.1 G3E family GTPase [Bacillus mesophilus]NEY72599.1 GTP-binding protein [Bacillus mesophilus]
MRGKTPVYIISGFLGSGKTTVLKKLVEYTRQQNKKVGLILNELGDVNVENYMFEQEQMVELLNGCICCSIQDDLKETLQQFIDNPVDILLIEGTGVANPNEIVDTLVSTTYLENFELKSIISLVDASNFLDYQSIFSSSKEIRQLLKEQITSASLVIVNKTDLISTKQLQKVEASIYKNIANDTPMIATSYGEVSIEELLKPRIRMITSGESDQKSCSCSSNDHKEGCEHQNHSNHASIKAVKLDNLPSLDRKQLQKWLKGLPGEIIRGKGIVQVSGETGLTSFQYAAGRLSFEKLAEASMQETVMILIGNNIKKDEIIKYYEKGFL